MKSLQIEDCTMFPEINETDYFALIRSLGAHAFLEPELLYPNPPF